MRRLRLISILFLAVTPWLLAPSCGGNDPGNTGTDNNEGLPFDDEETLIR